MFSTGHNNALMSIFRALLSDYVKDEKMFGIEFILNFALVDELQY